MGCSQRVSPGWRKAHKRLLQGLLQRKHALGLYELVGRDVVCYDVALPSAAVVAAVPAHQQPSSTSAFERPKALQGPNEHDARQSAHFWIASCVPRAQTLLLALPFKACCCSTRLRMRRLSSALIKGLA